MLFKTGDMFSTTSTVLAHGVNTKGVMGAGIAPVFKKKFPKMFDEYANKCLDGSLKPGSVFRFEENGYTILNITSQDLPGANATIGWLTSGLCVAAYGLSEGTTVAMPLIGCGIGGLAANEDYFSYLSEIEYIFKIEFEIWSLTGWSIVNGYGKPPAAL